MKLINLLKTIPFLLPLCIVILLNINNQKQYTKLKILIWNTPSLTIGQYIAISSGSGFILSYIVTSNFAKYKQSKLNKSIKYKVESDYDETNLNKQSNKDKSYDNTLIERDIRDPYPTINANFRVIGKTTRINESLQKNYTSEYDTSEFIDESNYQYNKEDVNNKNDNEFNQISNDWENDTYENW